MCRDRRGREGGVCSTYDQLILRYDMGVAASLLRIPAAGYDSLLITVSDAATGDGLSSGFRCDYRLGSVNAMPIPAHLVPMDSSSHAYGEVFLSWDVQAGKSLLVILGSGREWGAR